MSKEKEPEINIEFKDQKILDINMEKEVKTSFVQYAMSVIKARALPDVRDGLKPVHRRILYAMYQDHLTNDQPFRKSATTVGNVLGRFHPHGDSAVYDAMVRLAQPFSLRYKLVDGHGNFGNIDGDGAAAYRYTEARMSKLSDYMLADIKKNVVDFVPNFDNKLQEPTVLPSRFPNLLVNGSVGIAVGMATNIPTHNMAEVIDGTIAMMENPDITTQELIQYIKGPDFPTGAIIRGTSGIREAYSTGRGKIIVRARAEVDEEKRRIIVTEIPYRVNKSSLVEAMAECVKDKRIEGITEIRDESGRDGLRIVIEYRRDANGQVILNKLYKYTQLQDTCAVNMLALVDNVPRVLPLKDILGYYIDFQKNVIIRRTEFELAEVLKTAHLNEGYKIAIDNIDEVIRVIRSSGSVSEAKVALMERFKVGDVANMIGEDGNQGLSEAQAQAIVEMPLGRLAGMERQKIEEKLAALGEEVHRLREILSSDANVKGVIRKELEEIKAKFGDERRTEIVEAEDDIVIEDLIERHTCVITVTRDGYIKRQPSDTYTQQRRGGKGVIGMTTKEEDTVEDVLAVNSHSMLMFFTNKGKIHIKKAYYIPEASRTAKGTNIVNIIDLEPGEVVTAIKSVNEFAEDKYLVIITKNGIIKRTVMTEFEYQRKGGKRAITLDDGDELLYVSIVGQSDEMLVATRNGQSVRFPISCVTPVGRSARGVIAIRLDEGDYVAGTVVIENKPDGETDENAGRKQLITITENGYGKRSDFDEFALHNRGGKGMRCHNINEKTGPLAGIAAVLPEDDIIFITSEGTVMRTSVSEIPVYSRTAGGVIVMRTTDGAVISNFTIVKAEEEEPEDGGDAVGDSIDGAGNSADDITAETGAESAETESVSSEEGASTEESGAPADESSEEQ